VSLWPNPWVPPTRMKPRAATGIDFTLLNRMAKLRDPSQVGASTLSALLGCFRNALLPAPTNRIGRHRQ
jgi:hypothetical protein